MAGPLGTDKNLRRLLFFWQKLINTRSTSLFILAKLSGTNPIALFSFLEKKFPSHASGCGGH